MELGQYQLQIFVSLVVILGAAFVALICDFLKGNNEQLRELAIELKVRREEEQKRSHLLTPRVAEKAERAPRPEKIAAPAAAHIAAPAAATHMAAPKEKSGVNREKKRTVNADALAAMERGAALAGTGMRPRAASAAPVRESKPEPKPEIIVASAPAASSVKGIKKDWGMLLSRNAQKPVAVEGHDLLAAVVAATNAAANNASINSVQPIEQLLPAGFQAGFHDGHVLSRLVQSRQPVSGLVVSIGVNSSRKSDRKLPESVSKLVESLIGPGDFAAQSGEDEFLLIYPREHGGSAQRKLSQIAQQLWDFQLRSLGSFQILFSWGGVEVHSESIEDAIASASERMQETKRGRKLLTMELPVQAVESAKEAPLRQAV
jgi:hypothetical protein